MCYIFCLRAGTTRPKAVPSRLNPLSRLGCLSGREDHSIVYAFGHEIGAALFSGRFPGFDHAGDVRCPCTCPIEGPTKLASPLFFEHAPCPAASPCLILGPPLFCAVQSRWHRSGRGPFLWSGLFPCWFPDKVGPRAQAKIPPFFVRPDPRLGLPAVTFHS